MDKETNYYLLSACVGAAVNLVGSSGGIVNKHLDFIFQQICDKSFDLYFEMKKRAEEHDAQLVAEKD